MNAPNLNLAVTTAQGDVLAPEGFQATLIANIGAALQRDNHPPCLLHAPTGSGKTFMLTRVLAEVCAEREMVWLWFVPFVNLVAQTLDAIKSNANDLTPLLLAHGRNQDGQAGQVLIATAQSVAKATARTKGYDADGDDEVRSVAQWVMRARAHGLQLGLVVDEAHIALDKGTEFGKFAQWLKPEYLLMATATPRDARLSEFLAASGRGAFESFSVSRSDVVSARLNKQYIEAVVYDLQHGLQSVTDLKQTVLRQAWARNQWLKVELAKAGIPLTPLLLVQVANGDKTVDEAERELIELCKVPPAAIGKHSADAPDPVLMAAIASDLSKEVLIFKQSAGTGFDAPRAFVLASTKAVNDADFAMQFIGRVMRVAGPIRQRFAAVDDIPPHFNTAYVYLANAEAQQGFAAAVAVAGQVKSQLEGQTEKLVERQTKSGASVFTNTPTPQFPLTYDMAPVFMGDGIPQDNEPQGAYTLPTSGPQPDLFADMPTIELDTVVMPANTPAVPNAASLPQNQTTLVAWLAEQGIRVYPRRCDVRNLPAALKRERRPALLAMSELSRLAARDLPLDEKLLGTALKAAMNRLQAKEKRTELTSNEQHASNVDVVTDRVALAREARRKLLELLPQTEEADVAIILQELALRALPAIDVMLVAEGLVLVEQEKQKVVRDVACWIARSETDGLRERLHGLVSQQAQLEDAGRLPDFMLFPLALPLVASERNIYGVLPPDADELAKVEQTLLPEARKLLREQEWTVDDGVCITGKYDQSLSLNGDELDFAQALDRAEFVEWWHRNPPGEGKRYAVRVVRAEHKHFFYPDFIVCLAHDPGDEPLIRLVETKESLKDSERKSRRTPLWYGKVLFLSRDGAKVKWVREDGTLGDAVDLADLQEMREWLRASRPENQSLNV
ncbi:DEAD/DEAH box helicase [Chitinilyticum litopenaei]|uniref:DEAD/DEAH box helicase n=1 Tax=Chitinilyticum litopenaei TaxID=1121276 RepID=UPI0004138E10|nr:DEAD/DEAH box helicase family protein [Chitinilyticum litopenaei]